MLDAADAYAEAMGLALPWIQQAREVWPDPASLTNPIRSLDLTAEGITTIIWATGYKQDFGWLKVDAFHENRRAHSSTRRVQRTGTLFPWLAVAVPTRIDVFMGCVARREIHS